MAGMSGGQRFMTDLLVTSLMADGGLEMALDAAILNEMETVVQDKVLYLYKSFLTLTLTSL